MASRLLLGSISVAPGDLVHHLERLSAAAASPALGRDIAEQLAGLLSSFPTLHAGESPQAADLAFDVAVQARREGSATDLSLGTLGLPLYWRPKVRLAARVYAVQSGKTRKVFSIDARMPWSIYLNRILSWRVVVGLDAPARRADMDLLLRRAADRLVARLRRVA